MKSQNEIELLRKLDNLKAECWRLTHLQEAMYDKVVAELEILGYVEDGSDRDVVDAATDFMFNNSDQSAAELLESLKSGSWPEVITSG